jgi:hypothetical protein
MITSCEWRDTVLLDRLQNGTHRGNGGAADQSTHGWIGLGRDSMQNKKNNLKNEEYFDLQL